MTPWSVRPMAGWSKAAARSASLPMLHAPSSSEYSEWTCRCATVGELIGVKTIGVAADATRASAALQLPRARILRASKTFRAHEARSRHPGRDGGSGPGVGKARPRRAAAGDEPWTMVEQSTVMIRREPGPLTLCYLTVPSDPQSIVVVSSEAAPKARRPAVRRGLRGARVGRAAQPAAVRS